MKIGIDLGTTNSALAWVDPREGEDVNYPPIHIFEVPQLVAPGKTEPRRTLPSFMFLEDGRPVGVYAREQGALVPTRLVHSVKSWLSNPDVDRTAKILPWDSQETGRVLSPVEVSAEFLRKFREAWDQQHATPLAEEDIVLTVPASFDEEARELTRRQDRFGLRPAGRRDCDGDPASFPIHREVQCVFAAQLVSAEVGLVYDAPADQRCARRPLVDRLDL